MIIKDLLHISKQLRSQLLDMYYAANAGHIGSSLSCIDIMSCIVLHEMSQEDEFILSKGHAAAALYVVLHEKGLISTKELQSFYKNGTKLPAHPAPNAIPNIHFATGSLGHGLPLANGIALSKKHKSNSNFVYVLISDGETNEGTSWEAAHFAKIHKLDNLVVVMDKNRIQGIDFSVNVLGDTAKRNLWADMGFEVIEINGHNIVEIINNVNEIKSHKNGKPKLIIANTIKGKGVSFMENTVDWHYWPMNEEQYIKAKSEIQRK